MNIGQALMLGIVQGLTEFLPVSSSGHLGLFQHWFNLQEPALFFDVFLHAASLLAIIIFFWPSIKTLKLNDYWLLSIGTLPAVIVGLLSKNMVELILAIPFLIGFALLITGIINLLTNRLLHRSITQTKKLTTSKSLMIGVFQSLALIPGISRSGTTLLGGLHQGLNKNQAFTFAFLLAVPAILGANASQIIQLFVEQQPIPTNQLLLAGGLGALVTSLFSLNILKKLIAQARFAFFGWYCLMLGSGIVLTQLMFN